MSLDHDAGCTVGFWRHHDTTELTDYLIEQLLDGTETLYLEFAQLHRGTELRQGSRIRFPLGSLPTEVTLEKQFRDTLQTLHQRSSESIITIELENTYVPEILIHHLQEGAAMLWSPVSIESAYGPAKQHFLNAAILQEERDRINADRMCAIRGRIASLFGVYHSKLAQNISSEKTVTKVFPFDEYPNLVSFHVPRLALADELPMTRLLQSFTENAIELALRPFVPQGISYLEKMQLMSVYATLIPHEEQIEFRRTIFKCGTDLTLERRIPRALEIFSRAHGMKDVIELLHEIRSKGGVYRSIEMARNSGFYSACN